jgi:hypothetical protein
VEVGGVPDLGSAGFGIGRSGRDGTAECWVWRVHGLFGVTSVMAFACHLACHSSCHRFKALIYIAFIVKGDKVTRYMMNYAHMQFRVFEIASKNVCALRITSKNNLSLVTSSPFERSYA